MFECVPFASNVRLFWKLTSIDLRRSQVELDINHNWTEFSSRSTTVHSLGVFEWTAARLYVPHKIRCRTYVWRDGRLVCRVLEAEGTRTSFDGKDGEVRWIYTFEFVSFYFQLMFDVAWASDALRPAHETLREELQQLSVLQVSRAVFQRQFVASILCGPSRLRPSLRSDRTAQSCLSCVSCTNLRLRLGTAGSNLPRYREDDVCGDNVRVRRTRLKVLVLLKLGITITLKNNHTGMMREKARFKNTGPQ